MSSAQEAAWWELVPEKYRERPEYALVADDPGLPRVLLIGDSISMGYTLPVRERLTGRANVHRAPDNCRSTRQTLRDLHTYLGAGRWDLIHCNWGIHDVTQMDEQGRAVAVGQGKPQVPMEEYARNLRALFQRLLATGAMVLFATTTPVNEHWHPDRVGARAQQDVIAYNQVALAACRECQVPVNDLFAILMQAGRDQLLKDGVHFNEEGYQVLGQAVADAILARLPA